MVLINGIDAANYLGIPASDIMLQAGIVTDGDLKAKQMVEAQFADVKVVPADLDGSTTVGEIYEKICMRIGQPLNAFVTADMES